MFLLCRFAITATISASLWFQGSHTGLFFQSTSPHQCEPYLSLAGLSAPPVEKHPVIHRAIRALEAAKVYMESAPHDFCGHRVAALTESNLALNELGLAVICDKRKDKSTGSISLQTSPLDNASAGYATERHPLIRQAIDALQAARHDLNSASHHYCGHRIEALEAVNRALTQLRLALN